MFFDNLGDSGLLSVTDRGAAFLTEAELHSWEAFMGAIAETWIKQGR